MSALLSTLLQDRGDHESAREIARIGLPDRRSEAWKYTSLRALERRSFVPAQPSTIDPLLIADIPAPRVVFVNGFFDAHLSSLPDLSGTLHVQTRSDSDLPLRDATKDAVFANISRLGVRDGLQLVAQNISAVPLNLVIIGHAPDQDHAWHLRHHLSLHANARLTVIEHHLGLAGAAYLANAAMQIDLGAGAELVHVRLQSNADNAISVLRTDAALSADAQYRRLDLELGAGLSRHEVHLHLGGKNAAAIVNGVLLGTGKRHVDTQLQINHAAVETRSESHWRALAGARSRVVLRGGIRIEPGADGSDAQLSSRNVLLGDDAEIDAQPALEIYADEVKAAHGATIGQLDAQALFYLRSRGIPENQARQMLTVSFCRDVLGVIPADGLRGELSMRLDAALTALQNSL